MLGVQTQEWSGHIDSLKAFGTPDWARGLRGIPLHQPVRGLRSRTCSSVIDLLAFCLLLYMCISHGERQSGKQKRASLLSA